ncbi:MAG: FRG domain-containing protein [Rhodothermaceae bacterium]|nr:FRG domain-containing protein [Rhodothermaceae bacterium]MXZ57688.1 FRG domain-containing protein [Rhodothermaceae bacterium]MYB91348.1 FRG domain-containing protein [Rhodothermaceae bacterium]MYD68789.1 FRG domain-containing protein [Rhodothermaceae bacterium]MYG45443.1 FRG domain-containing protein [Rhodothermaceae bacterium]
MAADCMQDTDIPPRTLCPSLSSADLIAQNDACKGANYSSNLMAIHSVQEFLDCLPLAANGTPSGEFLYRGQADSSWRVDCSAVRRLVASQNKNLENGPIQQALVGYLHSLLSEVSRYVGTCAELPPGCTQLHVLAQLQHFGAATGLIDFTLDPLKALWFASQGSPDKDGAVYVLPRADLRKIDELDVRANDALSYFYGPANMWENPPYVWEPKNIPGRAFSQQSVFVIDVPFVAPFRLRKCVIAKRAKEELLRELQNEHDIHEENLFADLPGFSQANSASKYFNANRTTDFWLKRLDDITDNYKKVGAHVDCGVAYSAIRDLDSAIHHYTEAIKLDPECIGIYVNRAHELYSCGDLVKALADCNTAICLHGDGSQENGFKQIAQVYYLRGLIHRELGNEDQHYADINKAFESGFKLYWDDNNFSFHPPPLAQYQMLTDEE